MSKYPWGLLALLLAVANSGCHHLCQRPEVTCVSVSNPCEPEGIPFYLPKPLLIISKNFRYVQDNGVGQMGAAPIPNTFDNQAQYADVKANISSSVAPTAANGNASATKQNGVQDTADKSVATDVGVMPPGGFKDGVTPDTFFTYQIVFVPDLTQKYALRVKGGTGEMRAAMNMVNGWMFTGLGPFYFKDSSTAQNILATGGAITLAGRGVADVAQQFADLGRAAATKQNGPFDAAQIAERATDIQLMMDEKNLRPTPLNLPQFAEIHIYEPVLVPGGGTEWRPVADKTFDRQILGIVRTTTPGQPVATPGSPAPAGSKPGGSPAPTGSEGAAKPSGAPSAESGVLGEAIVEGIANRWHGGTIAPPAPQPQAGFLPLRAAVTPASLGNVSSSGPALVPAAVQPAPAKESWLHLPHFGCHEPRPRQTQDVTSGTATIVSSEKVTGTEATSPSPVKPAGKSEANPPLVPVP